MDKKTILAIVLCIGVWLAWQAIFGEAQKKQQVPDGGMDAVAAVQDGGTPDGGTPPASPPSTVPAQPPRERSEEKVATLKTELMEMEFSTRGASAKAIRLPQYQERNEAKKKAELGIEDLTSGKSEKGQSFGLRFKAEKTSFRFSAETDWEIVEQTQEKVTFRFQDPAQPDLPEITKTFAIGSDPYVIELSIEIINKGVNSLTEQAILDIPALYAAAPSSGCMGAPSIPRTPMCLGNGQLVSVEATPGNSKSAEPSISWTGINEQYFLTAAVPLNADKAVCLLEAGREQLLLASLMLPETTLPPGGSVVHQYRLFCGPKHLGFLEKVTGGTGDAKQNAGLARSVDYGWLAFLCMPMLWLLKTFFGLFGNYGIAIILLTIVVKLLLWPLTNKSMKSMRAMAKLKPMIDDLKKRCGDNKQKFNEEMMALYKAHGVNPLSGCLPMLLQMPIWIALYRTLYSAVELYQTTFIPGWIDDLSYRDPLYILPVAMGIGMFFQQKLTPTSADNQQAKMMLYFMPIFFTFIMLYLPSGLTLYIFVSSLLSIGGQVLYNRKEARLVATSGTAGVK